MLSLVFIAYHIIRHPISTFCAAVLIALFVFVGTAHAATSAQVGTVLTVQPARVTQSQRAYSSCNGWDGCNGYSSDTKAIAGGVIGGLLGLAIGRHSTSGRYIGSAGGAAIGTAIGRQMDERDQQREQQLQQEGAQVVVKLQSGQTVAVFTRTLRGIYPGAKVWLVGNQELIPES